MRGSPRSLAAYAVAGLLAIGVAACGGSSSSNSSSGGGSGTSSTPSIPLKPGENPVGQQLYGKKKGGTLTVYSSGDFIHFDTGEAYYALDYSVNYATERPLFSYLPNTPGTTLSPDLATAVPTVANGGITDGGKTITVHIRPGVFFS